MQALLEQFNIIIDNLEINKDNIKYKKNMNNDLIKYTFKININDDINIIKDINNKIHMQSLLEFGKDIQYIPTIKEYKKKDIINYLKQNQNQNKTIKELLNENIFNSSLKIHLYLDLESDLENYLNLELDLTKNNTIKLNDLIISP